MARKVAKGAQEARNFPHSWSFATWPAGVYPHDEARARYLVKSNQMSLTDAGALVRVGRELVVLGTRYDRWLAGQVTNVGTFEIAPNRVKRGGDVVWAQAESREERLARVDAAVRAFDPERARRRDDLPQT